MGIENNRDAEKNQEQTIERNETKPEQQEQFDKKINDIEHDLNPPTFKDPKGSDELQKEQEGLKKNEGKQGSGEKEIKESKIKEENKELSDDKLNSIESSLQPKVPDSSTENQGGSTKENSNYEVSKTEESKENKEELEKRLEQVQERKSSEDYDRLLPSEKEANDKEENELKKKLKSYENPEEQLNQEASVNKSKQDISEIKVEKNKVQEEKPQTIEEKLNNIENSLQPKGIEDNEINIKEESNSIEKNNKNKLGTVEDKNLLENNERTFTNNEEAGNVKEKQTNDESSGESESNKKNQEENVEYDESSKYDNPTSSDANNELSKVLEPFEQNKWDSMDMDERKAAISELGNSIASDLNLQEKPEIKYYNNSSEEDFGGYSHSENTIYINENNMGDAAETANTIAHESRHCWQRERAELPENEQTTQDKEFKDNFDNYVSPDDNYRAYKNQPVEADARQYAADISSNIPKSENGIESGDDIIVKEEKIPTYSDLNQEKGDIFDKSELPNDFERKVESFKKAVDVNGALDNIYANENLSNAEKVDEARKCTDEAKATLSDSELKKIDDAPSDARALKNQEHSDWTDNTKTGNEWKVNIDFPDKMGLDFDKTIMSIGYSGEVDKANLPDTAIRYGGEGGYNYTKKNADGSRPTLNERSVPKEYVPQKDREVQFDNDKYCKAIDAISEYQNDPEGATFKLNEVLKETGKEPLEKDEVKRYSNKYRELQNSEFGPVRDKKTDLDTKYGVRGQAKEMRDSNSDIICEGGATQFNTALPEYMLKELGIEK